MPKNSIEQLKQDEKKILEFLENNANKPINDIAKSLGFSRQKVWRVIKKLEKNNTIWGYNAVINSKKLDRKEYMLIIKRSNKAVEEVIIKKAVNQDFYKDINKLGVKFLYSLYTNGFFDWIIYFTAPDLKIARHFLDYVNKNYEGYVSESHLLEVMFPMTKGGATNPEIKELGNFFGIQ
jgi:DNA-binding Lrp family transcriptional regulator